MVALLKMPRKQQSPATAPRLASEFESDSLSIKNKQHDRRAFPRKEMHARIEGRRMDHALSVYKQPSVSLALRDLSVGGLSAISDTPMQRGERVTVFFPPQGIRRGWDAYGRIVRCEPSALGYRVAIEFDALPAA
jgi:hypothetical protein